MSKFELSITPNYVANWTLVDAIRELFQNALDQQTVMKDNDMFFSYRDNTLQIGNKKSVLGIRSLLLGETTKQNDDSTIGKFGEGYKVATLVLLRLGKQITFYNYGAKEVWRPRFVDSRRYGTKILTFFVDKKYAWQQVPDNNLTIAVDGITNEEYKDIVESNLHLQTPLAIETSQGRILTEDCYKGKIFVNGLFICKFAPYKYGYDFKPKYIRIDRDRKLVSDFDLRWLASQMWAEVKTDEVVDMVAKGLPDVGYINSILSFTESARPLSDRALEMFVEEFGDNAIPVSTQEEVARLSSSCKPVIVKEEHKDLIKSSSRYIEPTIEYDIDPLSKRFNIWFSKVLSLLEELSDELQGTLSDNITDITSEFNELLIDLKDLED